MTTTNVDIDTLQTHQMAIDLAATDIITAAGDYFGLFPDLREFKVKLSDDGKVILDNGRVQVWLPEED